MRLIDALRKRRSVTRYSHKKPDWRKILRAIDYARFIPSAGNIYAIKFILVSDKEKIKKITEATQQPFVGKAHFIVVVTSDPRKLQRPYGERGKKYMCLQSGVAIGNFMAALVEFGLATKWVRFFYEDKIKRVLSIPEEISIDGIFPIGIETKLKTQAEVFPLLENIIFFDKWEQKEMTLKARVLEESL
ncbi:hypothetical protein D6829_01860 [Candidatus Pacearchaeota archaeon]|nr:MAG: hypothetical protein D6829_01860 [Candidatus Pacearchaeota archaeon]